MVQLRMIQNLDHGNYATRFRIICAIYQALDPRMQQSAGAHRARFNCSKQLAVVQAMVTNGSTGLAQGHDLGMSGWIEIDDVAVPAAPHDAAFTNHDRADGDLSALKRPLRAAQGFLHPEFIGGGLEASAFALGSFVCF